MKPFPVFLFVTTVVTGAMAQPGPTTRDMTCAQARSLVASRGVVVLRTGPGTYDRYVRDASLCAVAEAPKSAWVRTADVAHCPVGGTCRPSEIENGH